MTIENLLNKSEYQDKLVIASAHFCDVAYEARGNGLAIITTQSGKPQKLYGSISDIKALADELHEIISVWEGIRT